MAASTTSRTTNLNLNNVTISHNTSTSASRAAASATPDPPRRTLKNTIVANNSGGGGNCSTGVGDTPQLPGATTSTAAPTCGFVAAGDINNGNPNLGPLANNGGPA